MANIYDKETEDNLTGCQEEIKNCNVADHLTPDCLAIQPAIYIIIKSRQWLDRLRKGSTSIVLLLQGLKNKQQQQNHPITTSYINLLKSSLAPHRRMGYE